jgi:hypothetical protein
MTPHHGAYLIFSLISLLMFMRGGYRWKDSWLAYVIAGVLFLLTLVSQVPLQKLVITNLLVPAVSRGESLYTWAMLPALVAGPVQEILKLAALLIAVRLCATKSYRYSIIGAFCGAGFALVEACMHAGLTIVPLFTLSLIERGFFIVYHTASGALLGRAMTRGFDSLVRTVVVLILVNGILRYLPVFVQQNDVTVGAMHFIFAFIVVVFLGFSLLRLRRSSKSRAG